MPVNEFEKQVQQKMDELQLRPSAEVWEEVERRIRKEKKRRGVILWIFILAMLLLGGTGWLFLSGNKKQSLTNNSEKIITAGDNKINDTNISSGTSIKQNEVEIKIPIDKKTAEEEKIQTAINSVTSKKENITEINEAGLVPDEKYIRKENKITDAEREIASKPNQIKEVIGKTEAINSEEPSKTKKENVAVDEELTKKNSQINSIKPDSIAATVSTESKINNIDSLSQQVAIKKEDSLSIKTEEKLAATDTNKKKKSKWEIWLISTGGISNNAKGLGVNSQKSLDVYQNMSPARSFVAAPVLTPAAPATGFMWQTAIYSKLILTKKISVSMGLNFSSYSTKQITGNFVDSLGNSPGALYSSGARGYYRSGTTGGSHINHYNFLEVPVSLHWQLNKGNKLPIVWQNGFATGFFIGGKPLVYNSISNIFYKDNKSVNKISFSYQSGLYAKLFNRNSNPITVGALFNYQLSKLQKEDIIGGNHLSSFGIQIGWLLKK